MQVCVSNVSLPFYRTDDLTPPCFVFAHGLGARNPKSRSHNTDRWTAVFAEAAKSSNSSFLTYTARGHGKSKGWQDTAATDPQQFTWDRLAGDMLAIADTQNLGTFIAGGSSMGGATGLYSAIQNPERVLGLVMCRPPTAWEDRLARRGVLLGSARRLRDENPDEPYYLVLEGAALSDLPARDSSVYGRVVCPVLLLAVEGDDAHPVSTALELHRLIPHSILHVLASEEEAADKWPSITSQFLREVREAAGNSESSSVYKGYSQLA